MVTSFALNDTTLSLTPGSSSRLLPTTPNPSNAKKAASELTHPAPSIEGFGKDEINVTCALTLDSYTTFDVYIAPKEEGTNITVTTVEPFNDSYEVKLQDDGRYRVRVEGIKAYHLNGELVIKGKAGDYAFTIWIRPLQYARTILNGDYDTVSKDAMAALYYYYYWSYKVML
jgi:hypothetical protein